MISLSPAHKQRFLSESPFFEAFSQSDLDRLAARLVGRRFAGRQMIFARGEPGSSMMAVVAGRVRISICSVTGRELLLGVVVPGQIFGEARAARRQAPERRCQCARRLPAPVARPARVPRGRAPSARQRDPPGRDRVRGVCARRPISSRGSPCSVFRHASPGCCWRTKRRHNAMRTEVVLSQGDLGQRIGAGRQKVNLHLGRWLAEGVLIRQGRALVIRDRARLAAIADEAGEISGP